MAKQTSTADALCRAGCEILPLDAGGLHGGVILVFVAISFRYLCLRAIVVIHSHLPDFERARR